MASLVLAGLATVIDVAPAAADGVPLDPGHVLVGVGNGKIRHYDASGRLLDTLDSGTRGESGGLLVDGDGALLAGNFAANTVTRYDRTGRKTGLFGQQYDAHPETIFRNAFGNVYVGLNDGTRQLRRFDRAGVLQQVFQPAVERRGVDWADLASDQCTLVYTSEGRLVKRFNVCADVQLPDLATLPITGDNVTNPTTSAYGVRILPSGEVLVATAGAVFRLSREGEIVRTYTIPRTTQLLTVNLDPDLATFWVGDLPTGLLSRVDLATGAVVGTIVTDPVVALGGVAVVGEVVAAVPVLRLDPVGPQIVGRPVTLTGRLLNVVEPQASTVRFTVTGANPQAGTGAVDESGRVTLTYVGANLGTDTVAVTAGPATPPVSLTSTVAVQWTPKPAGLLVYDGATTGAVAQPAFLAARLTDAANLPVVGEPIVFVLQGAGTCTAPTAANGVATCAVVPTAPAPAAPITANFPGSLSLLPAAATATFTATPEGPPSPVAPAAIWLTGPPSALQGEAAALTARVVDTRSNAGIPGVPVTFAVNAVETCTAVTDATGTVTCLLTSHQAAGRYPVTVTAPGAADRLPSSTTGVLVVVAPSGPVAGGRAVVLTSLGPLLAGVNVSDTGRVASEGATTGTAPLIALPGPELLVTVPDAVVSTFAGGASARATAADLAITLGGLIPKIAIKGVETTSVSTCADGSSARVRIANIAIGPITLFTSDLEVPPNTAIVVPPIGALPTISLVLNEQVVVHGVSGSSVTANAIHLAIPGLLDIAVAHADTDVRNCPHP